MHTCFFETPKRRLLKTVIIMEETIHLL